MSQEAIERARVVEAARAWLGTPYHHAADLRGVGVDCAMLLVRVFCDIGLVAAFEREPYLSFLLARAREVPRPGAGDVIVFRIGRCYAHGGIVTAPDPLTILHAFL